MRRFYIYLLLVSALTLMVGCQQGQSTEGGDVVVDLGSPEYGYIQFDFENGTRGDLYEKENPNDPDDNRLYANFGVMGYTYLANDWTIAEVQAQPTVFHNQEVVWNGEYGTKAMHTYSPMKEWLGKQKYAFFAYYPYGNSYVQTSSKDYEGNPYIEFTLPSRSSVDEHVDVMTGYAIDANYTSRTVGFHMQHRLTALDVTANNLFTNGEKVVVTGLTITLENLLYDKVCIPLNDRDVSELDYFAGMAADITATYNIYGGSHIEVVSGVEAKLTEPYKKSMIIIPQNQHIDTNGDGVEEDYTMKGEVIVTYKVNETLHENKVVEFSVDRDLKERRHYFVQLNFADGDVNIVILESDEWKDSERIDHEFE
ncbi:MAG: fimbrillin family protein [Alistipes sp.]|nr:fimbrillin family protein [Alistipes sp.]